MTFLDRHMVLACTVVNRVEQPEPDVHGNPVYADAEPIPTMCFVSPRAGIESPDGRGVEQGWTVYLPSAMAGRVNTFSYLDVEGYGRMECDGEPMVHRSLQPPHWPHHVEVSTRRGSA